jgi:hypothetical protein
MASDRRPNIKGSRPSRQRERSQSDGNLFRRKDGKMAVKTVQEAFLDFEREKVRVPAWQNEHAQRVHPDITRAVQAALGDLFARSFLAGSYRRKVQTVRLNDVDIVVVLNDPQNLFIHSALAALEAIREAAATSPLVVACKTSVRAVKLDIHGVEFRVDLVTALEDPAGEVLLARYLPEETSTTGRKRGLLVKRRRRARKTKRRTGCSCPPYGS